MFAEEMIVWEEKLLCTRTLTKHYTAEKQKMIKQIMVYLSEDTQPLKKVFKGYTSRKMSGVKEEKSKI